jgi:hypothetical protein
VVLALLNVAERRYGVRMPITDARPKPPPPRPAHFCVLISCENQLERLGLVVCSDHWYEFRNMCRGKERHTETLARLIALKNRHDGRQAYQCPVCSDWHTGHDYLERDMPAHREKIAFILEMFRRTRGDAAVDRMLREFDPASGRYSRAGGAAA